VTDDRPEPRGVQPPAPSNSSSLPASGDPKRLNQ
jgi:hypothetical protein